MSELDDLILRDFDQIDVIPYQLIKQRRKLMEEAKVDTTKDDAVGYKPLYKFMIAGVQHHQINSVLKDLEENEVLILRPEPTNKFDPNAIRIEYAEMDGGTVMLGYVPKKISSEVSAKITVGKNLECVLVKLDKKAKPWEMAQVEIREIPEVDRYEGEDLDNE